MTKCNTLRNYRIASLYGRMSYSKIARIIGCSRSCVAGVIRWHVKQMPRYMEEREGLASRDAPMAPSVAYVRGLEAYGNTRYIMRSMDHGEA